jgi:CRP-like cAMP-binding protein
MWDVLIQNLAKRSVLLDAGELETLQSLFTHRKFRKNQYVLQEGNISGYENFIVKGLTRTYEVDDKGQEHVLFFGPEDWWVGDLYSFLSGTPSIYNVDCLEDTEVLQISKQHLDLLYEKVPKMNLYFRVLFQNAFISTAQRVGACLSKSALERYQEFKEKYPHIEQRIPNHQIASFLGITPQSLSRIRRQYAGKL